MKGATSYPDAAFARVDLEIASLPAGARFGRIFLGRYPDPLGFGKTPSRFSDPRRRIVENRFGVLYLGSSLTICFLEAVLRDRRNGSSGAYPIEERELTERLYAEVELAAPLDLVDLRGNGPVRMGVPSDVAGAARQELARQWSLAFHEHPSSPAGIVYPSRLNGETNLAVYDRAVSKLRVLKTTALIANLGLARVLDALKVALA